MQGLKHGVHTHGLCMETKEVLNRGSKTWQGAHSGAEGGIKTFAVCKWSLQERLHLIRACMCMGPSAT